MPPAVDPPDWAPHHPERFFDPTIRRRRAHRFVTACAKLATRGRSYRFFEALSISPRLFRPYLAFNARLMLVSTFGRRDTELVILRVAARCGSRYEWVQHTGLARRAGLGEGQIAAALGTDAEALAQLSARDYALLAATDELLTSRRLSDATWCALRESLDSRAIMELSMLVGSYAMLAGMLNTFGVPLEPAWTRDAA